MLKWLLDRDGNKVTIEDARAGALDEEYPRALIELCMDREWTGVPSVTQCLKGTREAFLRIITPYGIVPSDMAFAILGTRAHQTLEQFGAEASVVNQLEAHYTTADIKGTADCLEQHGEEWWLIDYKTWGSYRVMKALGHYQEDEVIRDDAGEPVVFKSGKRKGEVKTRKVSIVDPEKRDIRDAELQLNCYRLLALKANPDIVVNRMRIFATVRDGGTGAAYSRGIDQKAYYFEVPIMSEKEVEEFFNARTFALTAAVETYKEKVSGTDLSQVERREIVEEILPPICPDYERWNGRKCCAEYCPVCDVCVSFDDVYVPAGEMAGPDMNEEGDK